MKYSEDHETEVMQEYSDDSAILPSIQGKVTGSIATVALSV